MSHSTHSKPGSIRAFFKPIHAPEPSVCSASGAAGLVTLAEDGSGPGPADDALPSGQAQAETLAVGSPEPSGQEQPDQGPDFELERFERIQRNRAYMQQLGLVGVVPAPPTSKPAGAKRRRQEAAAPQPRRTGLRSQQGIAAAQEADDGQVACSSDTEPAN